MKKVDSLSNHPAVLAWRKVDPHAGIPSGIEVLRNHSKSKVYRLKGIGANGFKVIAKGCKIKHLLTEQIIYEQILPDCHFASIKYYGFVKNSEGDFSWLFVEDAQGEEYDRTNKHHRMAAMQWLAALHTNFLSDENRSLLPNKGVNCYYEYLQKAYKNTSENINNPHLTNEHVLTLKDILLKLEQIEKRWHHIKSYCESVPMSFIHGDIKNSNVRIRRVNAEFTLVPFDWASAGWGIPAIDLGGLVYDTSKVSTDELKMYSTMSSHIWKDLDYREVQNFVHIGKILMLIYMIYADSIILNSEWIWKPMKRMGYYHYGVSDVLNIIKWK